MNAFHKQDGKYSNDKFGLVQSHGILVPVCIGENIFNDIECIKKIIGSEKDPSKKDEMKRGDNLDEFQHCLVFIQMAESNTSHAKFSGPDGENKVHTMQPSPDNKCPICTVPEAADQKDDHQVGVPAPFGNAVATERDIKIILEPAGERYMPALPEFRNIFGKIGALKIIHEVIPHHLGCADSDIGISGKVTIDLESKKVGCHDQRNTCVILGAVINTINQHGEAVRNNHFFKETPEHEL